MAAHCHASSDDEGINLHVNTALMSNRTAAVVYSGTTFITHRAAIAVCSGTTFITNRAAIAVYLGAILS